MKTQKCLTWEVGFMVSLSENTLESRVGGNVKRPDEFKMIVNIYAEVLKEHIFVKFFLGPGTQ